MAENLVAAIKEKVIDNFGDFFSDFFNSEKAQGKRI